MVGSLAQGSFFFLGFLVDQVPIIPCPHQLLVVRPDIVRYLLVNLKTPLCVQLDSLQISLSFGDRILEVVEMLSVDDVDRHLTCQAN